MQENEVYNPNESGHIEVRDLLCRCKQLQYVGIFISEGFDSLKSLCEVSEDDMIAMKVKRGHRRVCTSLGVRLKPNSGYHCLDKLIQREIATFKGIPRHEPLWITRHSPIAAARSTVPMLTQATTTTSSDSSSTSRQASGGNTTATTNSSGRFQQTDNTAASSMSEQQPKHHHHRSTIRTMNDLPSKGSDSSNDDSNGTSIHSHTMLPPKRRYRRHPKPDRNAPVKPPSAYVMFSNDLRAKVKDQHLTFAQLAKIAGERWKALSTAGKSQYEKTATEAKNAYLVALNQYRHTPESKHYQEYLKDFRAKHEPHRSSGGTRKKIKPSAGSPGSGSLADSSSNGNSNGVGSSSGSSGGSADGYYYDRNHRPKKSKVPTTTNDEDEDGAVVRGFSQIPDDGNNSYENWRQRIHPSITSFTDQPYQSSSTLLGMTALEPLASNGLTEETEEAEDGNDSNPRPDTLDPSEPV